MTVPQHLPGEIVSATLPPQQKWQRWRGVAQGVWIVLALALLGIFIANLSSYYQSSLMFCNNPDPSNCPTGQLSPISAHLLTQVHLSVTAVAIFFATLTTAVSAGYWVVGLLIFWRKSQEWMGLFVSLVLLFLAATNIFGFPTPQTPPFVFFLDRCVGTVIPPILFLFIFTFPTGRFTKSESRMPRVSTGG